MDVDDILVYFCANYPHKSELSKTRITKMVYLADWRHALEYGTTLTDVRWAFDHYGPYSPEVTRVAEDSPRLHVEPTTSAFGGAKFIFELVPSAEVPDVTAPARETLDFVIEKTKPLSWRAFIDLVYRTYPIRARPQYSDLNLVDLAREYEALRREAGAST